MTHQLFTLPRQAQLDATASLRLMAFAKAYFFETGTTTPQDTYTTSERNVAHENPVVADSAGVFPAIYLDPERQYKLQVKTAADTLVYEQDPVNDLVLSSQIIGSYLYDQNSAEQSEAIEPLNRFRPWGDVERYATNSTPGTTDMTVALTSADEVSAAGGGNILVTSLIRVSSDLTLSKNSVLEFKKGGGILVDSGKTLTIRCSIIAPEQQIFSGTGTVVYDSANNVRHPIARPEWFGAVHDNSTDDTAATRKAIAMVVPCHGVVMLSNGQYSITDALTEAGRVHIFGVNQNHSLLVFRPATNDTSLFTATTGIDSNLYKDFGCVAAGAATGRRAFTYVDTDDVVSRQRWLRVEFTGFDDWCIARSDAQYDRIEQCRFVDCHASGDDAVAITYFPGTGTFGANSLHINECEFQRNDRDIHVTVGTSVHIRGGSIENTGASATSKDNSIQLDTIYGGSIRDLYMEGVRSASSGGAIVIDDCVDITVESLHAVGRIGGTTYTTHMIYFDGASVGCAVLGCSLHDVTTSYIRAGSNKVTAHRNTYWHDVAGVQTRYTAYADIIALISSPENVELDQWLTFTLDPADLADGAGQTQVVSMTGARPGDAFILGPPYDMQDMVIGVPYCQANDTVEFRLQQENAGSSVNLGSSSSWKIRRMIGSVD